MLRRSRAAVGRLLIATVLAATLGSGAVPGINPPVAHALTIGSVEGQLLSRINQARAANGLVPLRVDPRLVQLAEYRAGVMAATNTLSHTIAGCLSCQLTANGIQWFSWGEDIAWTGYGIDTAADTIFSVWHDASHWATLMSAKFNYIGVGIAYRSSNNKTWSSAILTESLDHTAPWASVRYGVGTGTTVHWAWTGGDYLLQTHTAGLKNYDVQYRVGVGMWVLVKGGTTSTTITLYNRVHGHYYGLRVRSRDWRGNVSHWSAEVRIWLP